MGKNSKEMKRWSLKREREREGVEKMEMNWDLEVFDNQEEDEEVLKEFKK